MMADEWDDGFMRPEDKKIENLLKNEPANVGTFSTARLGNGYWTVFFFCCLLFLFFFVGILDVYVERCGSDQFWFRWKFKDYYYYWKNSSFLQFAYIMSPEKMAQKA